MAGGLLGIGVSSLTSLERALDTVGHNISNANNPDYNRQIIDLTARTPIQLGSGFIGTGVQITGVRRTVDNFLLESIHNTTSTFNELSTNVESLKMIDDMLADQATGLSQAMNAYFSALEELTSNPSHIPTRQLFISQAQVLENRFNDLHYKISSENKNINIKLEQITSQINGLATGIANLNVQITTLSANANSGSRPNDLFDQRDGLINDLAQLVSLSIVEQNDSSINVFIGNGQPLVVGGTKTNIGLHQDPFDSSRQNVTISNNNSSQDITHNISGGKLGGALMARDNIIAPTLNAIGKLAITLSSTMNDLHQKGIDLNGNIGKKIFTDFNSDEISLKRAVAAVGNSGSGVLNVTINPISDSNHPNTTLFSQASTLVNSGTLNTLNINHGLSLNGVYVAPTSSGDDVISTSDNSASAIAIAKVINQGTSAHGIKAIPQTNNLYMGLASLGSINAGELVINGINIVSTGVDENTILRDINSQSYLTGVLAVGDGALGITLQAYDGRNIQLTTSGTSTGLSFGNFNTTSGILNKVQKSGVALSVENGTIVISGLNPGSVGLTAGSYPIPESSLTTSDYQYRFDGTFYQVTRLEDSTVVAKSLSSTISVDGFTVNLASGIIAINDTFNLRPTKDAAGQFTLNIVRPDELAMASPIRVKASMDNNGTGAVDVFEITNTSGLPASSGTLLGNAFQKNRLLMPPVKISFISEDTYRVFDMTNGGNGVQIGTDQSIDLSAINQIIFPISGVIDKTLPGPNAPYVFDPGYRLNLTGKPKTGDVFTITYNDDASGDNRNALLMTDLKNKKVLSSGNATFQESYSLLVGQIGIQTSQMNINVSASQNVMDMMIAKRDNFSGVSLDEEAANLIKFEQAYSAAAQLIVVARNVFDVLMNTFRR